MIKTTKPGRDGSVRVTFDWASAQPYESWPDVPPSLTSKLVGKSVPTSFAATDEIVALATEVEAAGATLINSGFGWHEARVPTIVTSTSSPASAASARAAAARRCA